MAKDERTKAERRQARAGGATKAERRRARAGGATKAERRQAKAGGRGSAPAEALGEDASAEERLDWRLARIEEAIAAQSERSEELLAKVNEVLQTSPESSTPGEGVDD